MKTSEKKLKDKKMACYERRGVLRERALSKMPSEFGKVLKFRVAAIEQTQGLSTAFGWGLTSLEMTVLRARDEEDLLTTEEHRGVGVL